MKSLTYRSFLGLFCLMTGCTLLGMSSEDPPEVEQEVTKKIEEAAGFDDVQTVGDVAHVLDLHSVKVEGVGLVINLDGTGSDPQFTAWRNILMEEMKKRQVENPNTVLASEETSLVFVRAYLRPGIAQGDPFDVEVFLPDGSPTTSLKGGWLMETRLSEGATVGGQLMEGRTYAKAKGPVMVAVSDENKKDDPLLQRGRVLGGGTSLTDRSLSIIMNKKHQTGPEVIRVGERINRRFSTFGRGPRLKEGLATPKTNKLIDLRVSPRYKHNLPRYLEVIQNLAIEENPSQKEQMLIALGEMLKHPTTARQAALKLEGIGVDSKRVLKEVLDSENLETRFYAAEALAYLGDPACARTLQETARDEPALRVWALTALASLDEAISHQMLVELMDGTSAETRYGAFRALWALDKRDPLLQGEYVGNQCYLHELDTQGPPMIHITRSFRPEVVMFGRDQQFETPLILKAGRHILVKGDPDSNTVRISRFALDGKDQSVECSPKVADVIRQVVRLGATYPDVVSMLHQAADRYNLDARVEVDALPEGGRVLVRDRREIPDHRPALFPTEYLSDLPQEQGGKTPDEQVDTDVDLEDASTKIDPGDEKNQDSTATDFESLLDSPGS